MSSPGTNFPEYEFNSQQNALLRRLANVMRFVSFAFFGAAMLYAIPTVVAMYSSSIVMALIQVGQVGLIVTAGVWTSRAATNMKSIVLTQGSDMQHLMVALEELYKLFTLGMIIIVAMVGLVGLAFVLTGMVAFGL